MFSDGPANPVVSARSRTASRGRRGFDYSAVCCVIACFSRRLHFTLASWEAKINAE